MPDICDGATKRFNNGILDEPQEKRPKAGNTRSGVDFDQRQKKLLSEGTEARGNLGKPVQRPKAGAREHRRVHRGVLQSAATALGIMLPVQYIMGLWAVPENELGWQGTDSNWLQLELSGSRNVIIRRDLGIESLGSTPTRFRHVHAMFISTVAALGP